jgi:hypothetical protein
MAVTRTFSLTAALSGAHSLLPVANIAWPFSSQGKRVFRCVCLLPYCSAYDTYNSVRMGGGDSGSVLIIKRSRRARKPESVCVLITAVPIIKLFVWGEGNSGGHVLPETMSRGRAEACVD